jgi:flagellar hook-basal body complex protein FliE
MQIPSISSISPNSIADISGISGSSSNQSTVEKVGKSFENVLNSLNESQSESDNLIQKMSTGQDVDLAQVMISTEENDVNFRVAMAIRDKLVDAYKEVMRMSV